MTDDSESLPRRFGNYLLFDKIGEGGMARIYLARTKTGLGGQRVLVVKEILPLLATSPEFCQLLIDEAKLSATLSHANIVQVTDLGRESDTLYIAMEYVEGLDLRQLFIHCSKQSVPLPVDFSLFIIMETLKALDYAHRKKDDDGTPLQIVHRDVSPSNVLLSVEGEVKLCDFGIARAVTTGGQVLPEEAVQGKAGYMSPEAASGGDIDARSDLFSAGIILYEMLSGSRLYKPSGGHVAVLERAQQANVPPLPERGYPQEERLRSIVMKALSKDAEKRFTSAQEMLRELQQYAAENKLLASSLRFGEWLTEHFGSEIVELRRERERAAKRLDDELASGNRLAPGGDFPAGAEADSAEETDDIEPLDIEPLDLTDAEPLPLDEVPVDVGTLPPDQKETARPAGALSAGEEESPPRWVPDTHPPPSVSRVQQSLPSLVSPGRSSNVSLIVIAFLAALIGGLLAIIVFR